MKPPVILLAVSITCLVLAESILAFDHINFPALGLYATGAIHGFISFLIIIERDRKMERTDKFLCLASGAVAFANAFRCLSVIVSWGSV